LLRSLLEKRNEFTFSVLEELCEFRRAAEDATNTVEELLVEI
jgi:hypothetical protein